MKESRVRRCYDRRQDCDLMASNGDCSNSQTQHWMKKFCPFSCGLCYKTGLSHHSALIIFLMKFSAEYCRCGEESRSMRIIDGDEISVYVS